MVRAATAARYANTRVDTLPVDVGRRIRAARRERGLSLAQVGGEDLTRSFLSLVETGKSRISLRALTIVADRLQLPISYFLEEDTSVSVDQAELALNMAETALSRHEPAECLRILDDANVPDDMLARERWLRGRALVNLGRGREGVGLLEQGLKLSEDSPVLACEMRYTLGAALYTSGSYDAALGQLKRALDEALSLPNDPMLCGKIYVCIGHVLYVQRDFEGAIDHYSQARGLFATLVDLNAMGSIYSGLSLAHKHLGDLKTALRYSKLSVAAFEARHNARQVARELNNLAVRYEELGDPDKALECANEAVSRARQDGSPDIEAAAHSTIASIYLKQDQLHVASAEARAAVQLAGNESVLAAIDASLVLADVADRERDHERADELYRRSLQLLNEGGHSVAYADAALAYSLLLRRRGETDRALEYALQAAQNRPQLRA